MVAPFKQGHTQGIGNGGLTGTTQAGEPQQAWALALDGRSVRPGDFLVVPDDVLRHKTATLLLKHLYDIHRD